MNFSKTPILIFFILICIVSCKAQKNSLSSYKTIEFGSGGGFAGLYTTYTIDLNEKTIVKGKNKPVQLSKKDLSMLNKKVSDLNPEGINLNSPYNLTYFIHFTGTKEIKLTWGDPGTPVPGKVQDLYNYLTELTKK
jgi:hypothetical protein